MTEHKKKTKSAKKGRAFESDTFALQSLRLIAAPDPKDDLSDEELVDYGKKNRFPAEMIQHLIDYVKTI